MTRDTMYYAIQLLDDPAERYEPGGYLYEHFYADGYGGAKMLTSWSSEPRLYREGKDVDHMIKKANGYVNIKYRIVPFKGMRSKLKVVKTRGYNPNDRRPLHSNS